MMKRKPKFKYTSELATKMYLFFLNYDLDGAPSVSKFARSVGATSEDIERFRKYSRFNRAYGECMQIRRDLLIDRALVRRFDPTFVKFLLSHEGLDVEDGEFNLRLEVKE